MISTMGSRMELGLQSDYAKLFGLFVSLSVEHNRSAITSSSGSREQGIVYCKFLQYASTIYIIFPSQPDDTTYFILVPLKLDGLLAVTALTCTSDPIPFTTLCQYKFLLRHAC